MVSAFSQQVLGAFFGSFLPGEVCSSSIPKDVISRIVVIFLQMVDMLLLAPLVKMSPDHPIKTVSFISGMREQETWSPNGQLSSDCCGVLPHATTHRRCWLWRGVT
jgi:hypothetical protein